MTTLLHEAFEERLETVTNLNYRTLLRLLNEIQSAAFDVAEIMPHKELYMVSLVTDISFAELLGNGLLDPQAKELTGDAKVISERYLDEHKERLWSAADESFGGSQYGKLCKLFNESQLMQALFAVSAIANWELTNFLLVGDDIDVDLPIYMRAQAVLEMLRTYFHEQREIKHQADTAGIRTQNFTDASVLTNFDNLNTQLSELSKQLLDVITQGAKFHGTTH